jgi:TolA-binding protein
MKLTTLAAAFMLVATSAAAQIDSREGIALQNQILELRQQMQALQQLQVQAGGAPPAPAPAPADTPADSSQAGSPGQGDVVAQLLVRVSTLEEEVRTLRGRVEELSNQQQRDHDDITKQIGDLAFKLNQGAAGATPGAPSPDAAAPDGTLTVPGDQPLPAAPPAAKPTPAAPHRTPEQSLKLGSAALARRDYAAAQAAAQDVLALGRGPRASDAQILLARAQAGQHDYKGAAASYYAVYKAAPKSPRGGDALIGVANAFTGMGDGKHACLTLVKFGAEFPHPDGAQRQAAAGARKRAGC